MVKITVHLDGAILAKAVCDGVANARAELKKQKKANPNPPRKPK